MERETGFEPATSTLARSHSTTELFPLVFNSAVNGNIISKKITNSFLEILLDDFIHAAIFPFVEKLLLEILRIVLESAF